MSIGLPQFDSEWTKSGFPSVGNIKYGTLMMIIKDDTNTTTKETFQRLTDVKEVNYTAENYQKIVDVFTYKVNKLVIVTIPTMGALSDVANIVSSTISDYIVYPAADDAEETSLISLVTASRSTSNKLKCIVKKQATTIDTPFVVQILITNPVSSTGAAITMEEFLSTFAAQRVGKPLTQSMTNDTVGKIASFTQESDPEAELALGVNVAIFKNNRIVYARDISSLTTTSDQYDDRWKHNQRVAVMDTIDRDIYQTWDNEWVGNYQNSGDNKRGFIASINKYIKDRADSATDPVEDGIYYVDWEEHKDILRAEGMEEDVISGMTQAEIEDIDTGTFVYINGQVQINGVMEDVRFRTNLATTVIEPSFEGGE